MDNTTKLTNCYSFARTHYILTDQDWETVLAKLSEGYSITYAARSVGATRQAVYERIERDPEFARAVKAVNEEGSDTLEDAMLAKALAPNGFLANIASLKARRRDKWGDQVAAQAVQPHISITINAPSPAELRTIVEAEWHAVPNTSHQAVDGENGTQPNVELLDVNIHRANKEQAL